MHTLRASEVLLLTWLLCSLELIVKSAQEEDPGSVSAPDPVPLMQMAAKWASVYSTPPSPQCL